jgi:hypothetical protein
MFGTGLLRPKQSNTDVDDWFSAYSACDQAYLPHHIEPQKRAGFMISAPETVPLIEPKQVSAFKPIRRTFRMGGIAI